MSLPLTTNQLGALLGLAGCLACPVERICAGAPGSLEAGRSHVYSGYYNGAAFESLEFVNSVVGWDTFFSAGFLGEGRVVANLEAGHIWAGHEVFIRPDGSGPAVTRQMTGTGALAEADFHATMVGHVLAGSGYVAGSDPAQFTYVGLGMAPLASLWSGAIATEYSATDAGAFAISTESVLSVYRAAFEGLPGVRPDVINSSWGGSDPAAASSEMITIDALARNDPSVALVASAGNSGNSPVGAPGANFNVITVGSTGGAGFLTPSEFSSSGRVDFYNPETDTVHPGVRSAVDIAAPGEDFFLAAYLGDSGSLGASTVPAIQNMVQASSVPDQYFINQGGTSFASPMVAGSVALLKEVALTHPFLNLGAASTTGVDSRVMKSVLMAGAVPTVGWDNGQTGTLETLVSTNQSLDPATGAGRLDLNNTLGVYIFGGTRDLGGLGGGVVSTTGWDFGSVSRSAFNEYSFDNPFTGWTRLSISLNWFAGRELVGLNGENFYFADLNLELWQVEGNVFAKKLAESVSTYNNSEFLRVDVPAGKYGLRVSFSEVVFELGDPVVTETYGLAWFTTAIPESSSMVYLLAMVACLLGLQRRKRGMAPGR